MDPSVLEAIRKSVDANPDNLALRLHYASLLVADGNSAGALEEAVFVLARQPDNLEALQIAAQCSDATGDKIRSHGYKKLLEALSWNSAKNLISAVPEPGSQSPPTIDDEGSGGPETNHPPSRKVPAREAPMREGQEPDDHSPWETERSEVTLKDVAGMEAVKKRLHTSFLGPMRSPDLRKLYGKSLRGGLLLYGPPGCGKTFIARAIAGELGASFLSIGIDDVLEMWIGQSERNLHELFQTARRHKPCVLFMDELDALGRKRSLMRHSASTTQINQLLSELDGSQYDNDGVFFLAATNHPWDVDSAMKRPGRLDRMLLVLPPDSVARESIVRSALAEKPIERIDFRWISAHTDEFSGADVVHLCDSAAEVALEESIESGIARPIRMDDFKRALRDIKPSTRSWLETARNHAIYANEGGIYDDLVEYLKLRKMI